MGLYRKTIDKRVKQVSGLCGCYVIKSIRIKVEKDKGKNTGHIGYLWGREVGERADMNEREVSEIKDVEPCKYFLFKTKECYIYTFKI